VEALAALALVLWTVLLSGLARLCACVQLAVKEELLNPLSWEENPEPPSTSPLPPLPELPPREPPNKPPNWTPARLPDASELPDAATKQRKTLEGRISRMQVLLREVAPRTELIRPLFGWDGQVSEDMARRLGPWEDPRRCQLCRQGGEDVFSGRLLVLEDGLWVHGTCGLWSSDAYERDFILQNVSAARRRSFMLKCRACNVNGATVGCCAPGCKENYHFLCALARGARFLDDKRVYCSMHTDYALRNENGGFAKVGVGRLGLLVGRPLS
jgi:hypothetical protein